MRIILAQISVDEDHKCNLLKILEVYGQIQYLKLQKIEILTKNFSILTDFKGDHCFAFPYREA